MPRDHIRIAVKAAFAVAIFLIVASSAFAQAVAPDWGAWSAVGHDSQHTGLSAAVGPATADIKWTFNTGYNYGGNSGPLIGRDGTIYTPSYYEGITAVNPDGSKRWTCDSSFWNYPALGPDGTLYAMTSDIELCAIDPAGYRKWTFPGAYWSPTVGPDGTIYAGKPETHELCAINPDGSLKWAFPLGNGANAAMMALATDGTIYTSTSDHRIIAVSPDGTAKGELAEHDYGNYIVVGPDDTLYAIRDGDFSFGDVCAIGPDGLKKWVFPTGGHIAGSALGPDGALYVGATNAGWANDPGQGGWSKLIAIDPDGHEKWEVPLDGYNAEQPIVDASGTVYIGADYGKLHAIWPDGSPKWDYTLSDSSYSASIGSDGTLYVLSDSLQAIGPGQTPVPPYVSISQPSADGTVSDPVSYMVSYTNASTITLSGGDINLLCTGTAKGCATVSGEGTTRTVTISGITGDGTMSISIAAGSASNAAGLALATGPAKPLTVDSEVIVPGDWRMFGHDAQHTSRSIYTGPNLPKQLWEFDDQGWQQTFSCLVIDTNGTIYFCGSTSMYAVTAGGQQKWRSQQYFDYSTVLAIGTSGMMYATTDRGDIRCVSAKGQIWWSLRSPGDFNSMVPPIVDSDGTIYTAGAFWGDGLYALNPDGSQKWRFSMDYGVWRALCQARDGTIYAASLYKLYALNRDGSEKWDRDGGAASQAAVGPDGTVYVCTSNDTLSAISSDGHEKWTFHMKSDGNAGPPSIGPDGTIYISCQGMFYAVNPDGTQKWQFALPESSCGTAALVDSLGTAYIGYAGFNIGKFCAINPDGSRKWCIEMPRSVSAPAMGPGGIVYVGGGDGCLYAIGEDDSTVAPSAAIDAPTVDWATSNCVFKVTYSGAADISLSAADVRLNTTGTATGTIIVEDTFGSTFDPNVRLVRIYSPTGNGTIGISIAPGTARNAAGSAPAAGPSETFEVTNPPTAVVYGPSVRSTRKGPIVYTIVYQDAASITLGPRDIMLDRSGTANGIVTISGIGSTTRTVTISKVTGEGMLGISIGGGTASNAVGSADEIGWSMYCWVVKGPPTISIDGPDQMWAAGWPVMYTVHYTAASLVTLSPSNIRLNKTGTANGTVVIDNDYYGGKAVWIDNITGDGTLGISIASGTASNVCGTAPAAGPSQTFDVYDSPPSGTISAPSVAVTKSGPVSYVVTYSHGSWVEFDVSSVSLNKTGTADASVSVASLDSLRSLVTLSSVTGVGSLGISVAEGAASNYIGSAPALGPSPTVGVTDAPPTVTISPPSVMSTKTGPVSYTITYTNAESVGLTASRVHLRKTGTATGSISVSGSGTSSRTVTISRIRGKGTLGISIGAGTAKNLNGSAPAAGPSATFSVGL